MKVGGPDRAGPTAAAARGGATRAQTGFSLGQAEAAPAPATTAPSGGLTGVASIDALLALQSVGGPLERKRSAVRRAGAILDVLDDLKIGLLEGGVDEATLARLLGAVREERAETDEPNLEKVLREIETRAAVEMAKLEPERSAA